MTLEILEGAVELMLASFCLVSLTARWRPTPRGCTSTSAFKQPGSSINNFLWQQLLNRKQTNLDGLERHPHHNFWQDRVTMAAAVLDLEYLSGYLSLPQSTLNSIVDIPTAELVQSVLEAVAAKAHEHDELVADKLRVDIELENAVRSSETRIAGLRSTVEKAQKTVEEVRTTLSEEGMWFWVIAPKNVTDSYLQRTYGQLSRVSFKA